MDIQRLRPIGEWRTQWLTNSNAAETILPTIT